MKSKKLNRILKKKYDISIQKLESIQAIMKEKEILHTIGTNSGIKHDLEKMYESYYLNTKKSGGTASIHVTATHDLLVLLINTIQRRFS